MLAFAALLGVAPSGAQALATDREQPIVIEAAAAEADNRKRVTVYRGDVVITQGTLRITGDTVWIYYDDANTITKAISIGKPAKFRQLADGKEDYTTADAERMEYLADQDLILLLGNARYGEGKDEITAPRIVYDSRRGRIRAGPIPDGGQSSESVTGEPDKSDRVRITITPKKK
ncbi:MAG: lipopolysaccharide transport periplasmic protein LptA [Gammaproteobacteria bacterium]|nr:MAG: lipopolysaccharide transport periplasmic protein LptA [Gammaproteobacteria bacterium]